MPLAAGSRLGPYEIVAPLGAGGMGEVYKARDARLERTVAIKLLPPSLAGDPEFRARFEREAKNISALNHPHICTLYDVGETADASFLVMEHLEGQTLADRLAKGPLPVDEALDFASQIADALDKAHRRGIVHRDLKPANVFLVRGAGVSGTPVCKLLDFGLAKMGVAAPTGSVETRLVPTPAPPGTTPLTAQGSILGTFQYMAPEQIEGQEADARTDIWAFGCVLYEMLTGRRAFEGRSQASLIGSILERQPTPVAELQPMTPPAVGRLVRTCLEKNPDNRFHTAHDLWLHLQWIAEGGSAAGLPAPVIAGRKRRDRALFAGATLGFAGFAAAGAWWLKPAPAITNVVTRFSYPLPEGQAFTRTGRRTIAISRDGTKIAYIANNQIYLRRMHELEAQPIRGTSLDPLDLTFSPDGEWLAFFVADFPGGGMEGVSLRRIPVQGGVAVTLCPAAPSFGARWQGDRIVFSLGDRILAVAETGGTPETLVAATGPAERLAQPQIVGNGSALLYTVRSGVSFNDAEIVIQPLNGGPRRVLVAGGMDARVVQTGHLLWIRDSTLFAQVIDLESLQLSGGPVSLVEDIRQTGASGAGAGQLALSETGTLVFVSGTRRETSNLVWVDRDGREEPIEAPPDAYAYPRVSPDGTKVVVNTIGSDSDIWIWDLVRKTRTKLTSGPETDSYAAWTPDSRWVVFSSFLASGQGDLHRRAADGTGALERLTETREGEAPQMVLADGVRVLVRRMSGATGSLGALTLVPLVPGLKPEAVFATSVPPQVSGEISPDGRWIAYQSAEGSTRDEIQVRPFPRTESGHWQISSGGGTRPMWSKSGRELFYVPARPDPLMSVQVHPTRPGESFSYSTPLRLFGIEKYRLGIVGRGFDISPDGRRFLMVVPVGTDVRSVSH